MVYLNHFDFSFISHFDKFTVDLSNYYKSDNVTAERKLTYPDKADFCGNHTHTIYTYQDATLTFSNVSDAEVTYLSQQSIVSIADDGNLTFGYITTA